MCVLMVGPEWALEVVDTDSIDDDIDELANLDGIIDGITLGIRVDVREGTDKRALDGNLLGKDEGSVLSTKLDHVLDTADETANDAELGTTDYATKGKLDDIRNRMEQ